MNQNIFCSKCHRIPSQCCCSSAKELTDKEIELLWDQSLNEKKGAELGFSTQTDYFNYLVKKASEK